MPSSLLPKTPTQKVIVWTQSRSAGNYTPDLKNAPKEVPAFPQLPTSLQDPLTAHHSGNFCSQPGPMPLAPSQPTEPCAPSPPGSGPLGARRGASRPVLAHPSSEAPRPPTAQPPPRPLGSSWAAARRRHPATAGTH